MMICQTVIDSVSEHYRHNVEGQIDMFGMSGEDDKMISGGIEIPDIREYSKGELTRMEREVTGLYLSGHPMDDYRDIAKRYNAVSIGDVLADFSHESSGGKKRFRDDQKIKLAGVIETVKTKPTRNNSLMAYLTLDDGSGNIELLAFQRVIDESGVYMKTETLVLAEGKISARDEKDPQIVLEKLRPITDAQEMDLTSNEDEKYNRSEAVSAITQNGKEQKTLYVKLHSEESPEYERLKLVHTMFPGRERMIIHFEDTKKNVGAKCLIHDAFVGELREMLGTESIVVR